ncbi:MAG: hypothetical protein ACI9TY_001781, partial [Alphaproteobacteria bacterium]
QYALALSQNDYSPQQRTGHLLVNKYSQGFLST